MAKKKYMADDFNVLMYDDWPQLDTMSERDISKVFLVVPSQGMNFVDMDSFKNILGRLHPSHNGYSIMLASHSEHGSGLVFMRGGSFGD